MTYRLLLILTIWLPFFGYNLLAQTPSYIHYETESGLPSNELYNVHQDTKGFLWIGSDAGLLRYDGYAFKLFTNKKQRGASVSGIQEDARGRIWCHNFSGQILYLENDSLQIFEAWDKYYRNQLIEFTLDKNNHLWVSNSQNYLYKFQLNNNVAAKLLSPNVIKQSIAMAHDGTLLFTQLEKGEVFGLENNAAFALPIIPNNKKDSSQVLYNVMIFNTSFKKQQTLSFQRQHPLLKTPTLYSYSNKQLTTHPVTLLLQQLNIFPLSVYDDDEGNMFIGTFNGCYWFKKNNNNWKLEGHLFTAAAISSICKDKEGNFWFASLKNGLYQVPNLSVKIFTEQDLGVPANNISLLAADDSEHLYVATSTKALVKLNTIINKVAKRINNQEERDAQAFKYDSLSRNLLQYKSSFSIIDKQLNTSSFPFLMSASKDFFRRKDGLLFVAGSYLTAHYKEHNFDNNKFTEEFDELEDKNISVPIANNGSWTRKVLSKQRSRCVLYDEKNKTLWAGFADATISFHKKQQQKLIDPKSGIPIIATQMVQLRDGTICMGTVEQGLYFLNDKKTIANYTTQNGLLANRIKKMAIGKQYLWLVTTNGIQGIHLKTFQFTNLTTQNGLLTNEVFDIAVQQEKVYLSTSRGLQFFPDAAFPKNNVMPICSIVSIATSDSTYKNIKLLSLAQSKSNIKITLQGIALKSKGSFTYEYRMIGLDENWVSVSATNNIVRYPSLPSGQFTFQARVVNEDGIKSTIDAINLTIQKEWYLRWWFIGFVLVLMAGIAYYIFNRRLQYIDNKNKEALEKAHVQEALRISQLSALKAQMNPHFMFNALNSIQEFIFLNEKKQANMYMGKFADLMRLTLDMSNKETITIDEEFKILNLYLELESLRFEEKFHFTIEADSIINSSVLHIPAMLIQPYVENAIKHGLLHKKGDKYLHLNFILTTHHTLQCTITDNGIGRKRSGEINAMRQKKYTSFATGATQKRLELLNYDKKICIAVHIEDLQDNMGNATGTKVILEIPLS